MKGEKLRFIGRLRHFAKTDGVGIQDEYGHSDYRGLCGDSVLASGLADWFSKYDIPDGEYDNFYYHFPEFIEEAYCDFRTKPEWAKLRDGYAKEGMEFVDLVNIHVNGLDRSLRAHGVARLCGVLSGESWLMSKMETYFDAQQHCIDQAWHRFVRLGYRPFIKRVQNERHRGNIGKFGKTKLMTYAMAGRVMFTFERGKHSVTYVADDSDMNGQRSGANATSSPFMECVSMINEVCDHWDIEKMVKDNEVSLGV